MSSEFVNISDALNQHIESAMAPEAPAQEAEYQEAPAQAPAIPDLDARMNKLSNASQKLQSDRQALAEERKQFAAQQAEYTRWKQTIEAAKEDPVALAELAGYTAPDEYATALIEKGTLSPERRRILELEKQVQEDRQWRTQFEAKQAQAHQEEVQASVMDQLKEFSNQNRDKYELVNTVGNMQDVLGVIRQHYQSTIDPETGEGEIMPYEQAFEIVENFLDKQLKPVLELNKIKSRYATAPAELSPEVALTNALASRKPMAPTLSSRNVRPQTGSVKSLTEAERMERAGQALLRAMNQRGR
jgi:hypothetical protein